MNRTAMKYLPYIGRNMGIVCLFVQIWNRMWCELYSNIGNFCCFTCRFSRYSVVIVTIRHLSLLMRYKQRSELVPSSPTIYLNFKIMIFERDRLNPGSHTLNLIFFLLTIWITRIMLIWFGYFEGISSARIAVIYADRSALAQSINYGMYSTPSGQIFPPKQPHCLGW